MKRKKIELKNVLCAAIFGRIILLFFVCRLLIETEKKNRFYCAQNCQN